MKNVRRFCVAVVFALLLSTLTYAGDIHTPAPAPQPAEGDMSTTVYGGMHTTNSDEATAGDAVVAGALSLVQSVLSLL